MSEPVEMELVIGADGGVRCIYDESLDLRALGKLQITRASHVEPGLDGYWWADMGPVSGPVLGPFETRGEALGAERGWLVGSECMNGMEDRPCHQKSREPLFNRHRHVAADRALS